MDGPKLPYAKNLKLDETLRLSDEHFLEKLRDGTGEERRSKEERLEGVIGYTEPYVFARFAFAAYQDRHKDENQSDYEKRLRLPKGWRLLTSARGLAFLGATHGYFGAAYWQPDHRRVVVAHRGTDPTNLDALRADLLGVVGHKYVKQMSAACTFARRIRDAVETVETERQISFEIFFTGHSLGAWLAQVTAFSLKYLTLVEGAFMKNRDDGYNARTVVFDSPGCEDTIRKMIQDLDVRYAGKTAEASSLDVTSYLSSPNFVNCCNTHIGKLYRLYPRIESKGFVRYTLSSHSMKGILETLIFFGRPREVVDWPKVEIDLWQSLLWKLPGNLLGKEYEDFFHFATDLNNYDPSAEEIKYDFVATNEEIKERFVRVRYQTKPARTNECPFNVFTESELEFLRRFQQLKILPNSLFEGEDVSEEYRSKIAEKLNNLMINTEAKTIRCEAKFEIFQLIPYVKTLLRLYPDLKDFQIRKQIYADITKTYRWRMEYLTNSLLQSDWLEFDKFLDSESSDCHVLAKYSTDSAMAKVLKVIESIETRLTVWAFEFQNLLTTETFLSLTQFLKSELSRDFLIAIECKAGTSWNRENFQLVQKLREEIRNGRTNAKLVLITDSKDSFDLDDDSVRVCHGGITWNELTEESQTEIISKNLIILQDNRSKLCLRNWSTNLSDFAEILDPETLKKFLKGDDVIVGSKIPDSIEFYVPRKFIYNRYIKEDIFDNAKDNDVVAVWANDQRAFSTIRTKMEKNWKKGRFRIIRSDEDFNKLREKNQGKNVHCLKFESNLLVWHKTEGSLDLIRPNIRVSGSDTNFENIEDAASKTLIISDAPGMGKSTVLAVLAQKIKERTPRHWVIRINLNDCAKALNDAKNNKIELNSSLDAAKFFSGQILPLSENTELKSEFERKLFEISLTSSGGIVLVLDAFDEISPDYEEIVLKLVKILNNSRLEQLVLSTRPHTIEQLEDQLGTLSRTMVPFSRNDQKEFLMRFWKKRLTKEEAGEIDLEERAEQCLDQLEKSITTEEGDFLGIPLQCELMAEYTLDQTIRGGKQPERLSLMELFEAFVRRKNNIYQKEKNSNAPGNISAGNQQELMVKMILKSHREYSLRLLLTREKWEELDFPELDEDREMIETEVRKAGLMLKTGDNPQFVHRTVAEFFLFDYILDLVKNTTKNAIHKMTILSKEILLQPDFRVTRSFLDGLIRYEKNTHETTAILRSFAQNVAHIWAKDHRFSLNRRGNTVLHELSWGGNHSLFDALLKILTEVCSPQNVKYLMETPGEKAMVALHIASITGDRNIARLLLEKGADINASMNGGATPLFMASQNCHLEIASLLLEKGANVNACMNTGETPLIIVSNNGHLEIATLLLQKGANINARTNAGATPLIMASQNGHLMIACLLLEKRASINDCTNTSATPLTIASENGHLEIVSLLLENGASINDCTNIGATPLFVASQNGHLEIASLLLEKRASVNDCTNTRATPLIIASENGHLEIVSLLLENGASINDCTNIGATSLFMASQNGDLEIVRLLLKKGAEINARINYGATPLYVASHNGHLEVASLLLQNGANINDCTNDGATPLFIAAQNNHLEIASLLLEKGASINDCTNTGTAPLFIASENGHLEIATLLLEKGANINDCMNIGATPLFIASQNGHLEVASLLLEKGANINACVKFGATPLSIAAEKGHVEIAGLLLEKGAKLPTLRQD